MRALRWRRPHGWGFVGAGLWFVGLLLTAGTGIFIALSVLAAAGLYSPYPDPPSAIANAAHFGRGADLPFDSIERRPGEGQRAYERRLTLSVNLRMIHYWPNDRRYVEVNPIVNLAMWLRSFAGSPFFADYEFVTPELAWHRGYGYCSQVSRIVYEMLLRNGIDATILQNDQHVIVEAGGEILDADYGVIIPYSAAEMEANPKLVEAAYPEFPSSWPLLERVYAAGFTESASKAVFAAGLKYESEATQHSWPLMLVLFWLALAVFDGGCCWARFIADLRRLAAFVRRSGLRAPMGGQARRQLGSSQHSLATLK